MGSRLEPCASDWTIDGAWAFMHIKALDERMAVGLLETELARSPERALGLEEQLVMLGERRYIKDLVGFMDAAPAETNNVMTAALRKSVLDVFSAVDARETLPALRAYRERLSGQEWILDAVIAQLERDACTLVDLAQVPPATHSFQALEMLDRIGAADAALELLERRARIPGFEVSARNEIAERRSRRRESLLLWARHLTPGAIELGDPIDVEVRVQNVSRNEVRLPGRTFLELRILEMPPRMRQAHWRTPPQPRPELVRSLLPGESATVIIHADQEYVVDRAGHYGISAELSCLDGGAAWTGHLESAWLDLEIREPEAAHR